MDVYLHVGPHKTGSTYLQKKLFEHLARLRGAGCDYPDIGRDYLWGHHDLTRWLAAGDIANLDRLRAYLAQASGTLRKAILSSERFSQRSVPELVQLRRILSPAAIRVVYYVRAPCERLYPMWQEAVKHGDTVLLRDFLDEHLAASFASEVLNDAIALQRLTHVFGTDALRIVGYDELVGAGCDIFRHFVVHVLGEGDPGPGTGELVNKSLPAAVVELLRALNEMHFRGTGEKSASLRDKLLASLARLPEARKLMGELGAHPAQIAVDPSGTIGEELCRQVLAVYGHAVVNSQAALLDHARRPVTIASCDPACLADPDAKAALRRLYERLRA